MRICHPIAILGLFAIVAGCGGSSGSSNGAGGSGGALPSGTGGAVGTGGSGSGGSDGGGTASCAFPSCVSPVMSSCQPTGTCVAGAGATTGQTVSCYANGIRVVQTSSTSAITVTYKTAASTCYSVEVSPATFAFTFKDGSSATLGTGAFDMATNAVTFTCTGGQPETLSSSCNVASLMALMGVGASSCTPDTTGTCVP